MKRGEPKKLTRRHLLQAGGVVLAASSVSARAPAAAAAPAAATPASATAPAGPQISRIMTTLSTYMAEAATSRCPSPWSKRPDDPRRTRGNDLQRQCRPASSPSISPAPTRAIRSATVAASTSLRPDRPRSPTACSLIPTDRRYPSAVAVSSSASVVPAALATGERFGTDGTRFIRARARLRHCPRFTATLGKLQYMVATHRSTHSLSGTFGSAAAAGCSAGLNAQQMRWLLSYTAQQGSGLASWQRDTDHIEKAFDFGGMPARNGVTAALLVQAGGTAVEDILSARTISARVPADERSHADRCARPALQITAPT